MPSRAIRVNAVSPRARSGSNRRSPVRTCLSTPPLPPRTGLRRARGVPDSPSTHISDLVCHTPRPAPVGSSNHRPIFSSSTVSPAFVADVARLVAGWGRCRTFVGDRARNGRRWPDALLGGQDAPPWRPAAREVLARNPDARCASRCAGPSLWVRGSVCVSNEWRAVRLRSSRDLVAAASQGAGLVAFGRSCSSSSSAPCSRRPSASLYGETATAILLAVGLLAVIAGDSQRDAASRVVGSRPRHREHARISSRCSPSSSSWLAVAKRSPWPLLAIASTVALSLLDLRMHTGGFHSPYDERSRRHDRPAVLGAARLLVPGASSGFSGSSSRSVRDSCSSRRVSSFLSETASPGIRTLSRTRLVWVAVVVGMVAAYCRWWAWYGGIF